MSHITAKVCALRHTVGGPIGDNSIAKGLMEKMMMKKTVAAVLAAVALFALPALADDAEKPEVAIKRALEVRPDIKVESVVPSEIAGLYAVQLKDGPVVYTSADGKYFVLGEMYAVQDKDFVNLSGKARFGSAREGNRRR